MTSVADAFFPDIHRGARVAGGNLHPIMLKGMHLPPSHSWPRLRSPLTAEVNDERDLPQAFATVLEFAPPVLSSWL